jgi:eukaryotic-like serine/threonine-protein kinase
VKAHNVMREEGGRVVLMDFGAGRSMQAWSPTVDLLAGTPLYLCPERLRGGAPTAATDIYSLGVLLYHLVTQDYPVEGATRAEVEAAHRAGQRTRLRDRRPDLPDAFVSAVERALSPEPSARFASAGAFEEALAAASARRRSPRLALGLAAVAVLAVATAVGLWRAAGVGTLPAAPAAPRVDLSVGVPRFEVSGEFQQVLDHGGRRRLDAGSRVEPTMALTFELQASRDVYVYIVNEDEQGRSYGLFPLKNTLQNPLSGGVTHVLPGGPPWEVDSTGGQEHLFVIVSPTPVPEIADAVAALPPATGEPQSEGKLAANNELRGIGGRRRASAADAARPWRQQAQPLLPGRQRAEGLWVREFILKNP